MRGIVITLISSILILNYSCASQQKIVTKRIFTKGSYIYFRKDPDYLKNLLIKKSSAEIEIFYRKKPDKLFYEVGIIEAVAKGKNVSLEDLFSELKTQAASMNVDPIYKI